jgi:hypothetical protein
MYEQIDFRFRYQVGVNSLHGTLLKYLQSKHIEFPREQMILWSLSAFWYPLACRWVGEFTEAELKQKARNAIYQLQQQINYLAQNFGLEPQDFASPSADYQSNGSSNRMSAGLELSGSAMSSQGVTPLGSVSADTNASSPTFSGSIVNKSDTNTKAPELGSPSLMRSADDDVLDEAFNN